MTAHKPTNGDDIARAARPNPADVARIRAALVLARARTRATLLGGGLAAIRRGLNADTQHGWIPGEIRAAVGELHTIEMTITPPEWMVRDMDAQPIVVGVNSRGEFFLGDGATFAPFPENTVGDNARRAIHVFNAIRKLNDAATAIQRALEVPLQVNQA